MPDLPLGPLADVLAAQPDGVALVDAEGERTWAMAVPEIAAAARRMVDAASDPDQRWGVLGDNARPRPSWRMLRGFSQAWAR